MARSVALLPALVLCLAAAAPPPEPRAYWTGAMEGSVPATLAGATVLGDAASARTWIAAHHPVIIDVAPAPKRPPAMPPGLPWLPSAHQDVPGSVWLPDAGRLLLTADGAGAYEHAVQRLAGAPPGRPVLAYCHKDCWASWNAAKFLLRHGYADVAWFPGGVEAWAGAGYDLQRTQATRF